MAESGPELHIAEKEPGMVFVKLSSRRAQSPSNQNRDPDYSTVPPNTAPAGLEWMSVTF